MGSGLGSRWGGDGVPMGYRWGGPGVAAALGGVAVGSACVRCGVAAGSPGVRLIHSYWGEAVCSGCAPGLARELDLLGQWPAGAGQGRSGESPPCNSPAAPAPEPGWTAPSYCAPASPHGGHVPEPGSKSAGRNMRTRSRGPSERIANLATDGRRLGAVDGRRVAIGDVSGIAELAQAARRLLPAPAELVVWVHESAPWALEGDEPVFCKGGRRVGGGRWWKVDDEAVWVAVAAPGAFGGTQRAGELLEAVESFREALGWSYVVSGGETLSSMICRARTRADRIGPSEPEPELTHTRSIWAQPHGAWETTRREMGPGAWFRAFDRVGSFLAAWRGLSLPAGEWWHRGPHRLEETGEPARPCGYWRMDAERLEALVPADLPNPFARAPLDDGTVWLTTPLAHLAGELAEGAELEVLEGWFGSDRCRALDPWAERIARARERLLARWGPDGAPYVALKRAYSQLTAWLQGFGPAPPDPLARPAWGAAIVDRHAANTWRGLRGCPVVALAENDCAVFVVDGPEGVPAGLRVGSALGSWKAKGPGVSNVDVAPAAGARALIAAVS